MRPGCQIALALSLTLAVTAAPAPAVAAKAATAEEEASKRVCRTLPSTGWRTRAKRICRTRGEWEQLARQNEQEMRDMRRRRTSAGSQ